MLHPLHPLNPRRLRRIARRLGPGGSDGGSTANRSPLRACGPPPAAPFLEALEARTLLSAVFDDGTGLLVITGTTGSDRIAVIPSGDGQVSLTGVQGVSHGETFTNVAALEIRGLGGADRIFVGDVVDLFGNPMGAVIEGGGGNDLIITGLGDDFIDAGDGNNRVFSGGGNDTILTGLGRDLINAGDGDDDIFAGDGHDKIIGGDGDDTIDGGAGRNIISGGDGDDVISAGDDRDLIFAGDGNDTVDAGHGDNRIDGGSGDDGITTGDGRDRISGDSGDDLIDAGHGDNFIATGPGFDTVFAGDGDDVIFTAPGDDVVDAGLGDNNINTSRGSSFRLRFGSLPRFVFTDRTLIASFGTRGLMLGGAGRIIDTFSFNGGHVFGTFGKGARSVISLAKPFVFTSIFRV